MRKQFVTTVESILTSDPKLVLLLGDIGVWGFNKSFQNFPDRVYNIGILEQSTIGLAAGLAMDGFTPIVHTIAPFLVERAFEQLKDDFGYQGLGGNFVSVGASYDYAALGCTHHCPADVGILNNIPNMEIILPGTASEFDALFRQSYNNGHSTYFRLSERQNEQSYDVKFGQAYVVKKGKLATVIAVGPLLKAVLAACHDLDVTILYYTTVTPFDVQAVRENCQSDKIAICEPYYSGVIAPKVLEALYPRAVVVEQIGIPRQFLIHYGKAEEHDEAIGFTPTKIRLAIEKLISI